MAYPTWAAVAAAIRRSTENPTDIIDGDKALVAFLRKGQLIDKNGRVRQAKADHLLHLGVFGAAAGTHTSIQVANPGDTVVSRAITALKGKYGAQYALSQRATVVHNRSASSHLVRKHAARHDELPEGPKRAIRVRVPPDHAHRTRLLYAQAYADHGHKVEPVHDSRPLSYDRLEKIDELPYDFRVSDLALGPLASNPEWAERFTSKFQIVGASATAWHVCAPISTMMNGSTLSSVVDRVDRIYTELSEASEAGYRAFFANEGFAVGDVKFTSRRRIAELMESAEKGQKVNAVFLVRPTTAICAELCLDSVACIHQFVIPAYYVSPIESAFREQADVVASAMKRDFVMEQLIKPNNETLSPGFRSQDFSLQRIARKRKAIRDAIGDPELNASPDSCIIWERHVPGVED